MAQIEAALIAVFGVDTQLIADGTYYVMTPPPHPLPPAAGASGARFLAGIK